jgi:hypothetical protein
VSTDTATLLLRLFIIVIYLFHKPEKISLCSLFDAAAASPDLFAITLLEMIACCSVHYVKSQEGKEQNGKSVCSSVGATKIKAKIKIELIEGMFNYSLKKRLIIR